MRLTIAGRPSHGGDQGLPRVILAIHVTLNRSSSSGGHMVAHVECTKNACKRCSKHVGHVRTVNVKDRIVTAGMEADTPLDMGRWPPSTCTFKDKRARPDARTSILKRTIEALKAAEQERMVVSLLGDLGRPVPCARQPSCMGLTSWQGT